MAAPANTFLEAQRKGLSLYRLYPTLRQKSLLGQTLEVCRILYNDALHERKEAYKICRKSLNYYDHRCSGCGLDTTRDHASALEILRLGLSLQASSTVSSPVLA
ncbi:MAG: hypothetical protein DMG69_21315 [Acidobacteria bacterium]|nr:MAG: hypothetical protein DMG69_21315 [Acidobacteriota bacterium]